MSVCVFIRCSCSIRILNFSSCFSLETKPRSFRTGIAGLRGEGEKLKTSPVELELEGMIQSAEAAAVAALPKVGERGDQEAKEGIGRKFVIFWKESRVASVGDMKRREGEVGASGDDTGGVEVNWGRGEVISGDGQGGRDAMVSSSL